jgi:hypothetical protein
MDHEIAKIRRDDRYAVAIFNGDKVLMVCGELAGLATGRWEQGFCGTTIPRPSDARYVSERFFKSPTALTVGDLYHLNLLYLAALEDQKAR